MRSIMMISASALALVASPAAARDGAWYVGGEFGAMIVEDVEFDFGGGGTLPGNDDAHVVLDHDYGLDGALFVGYDLGAFRLEAEVAYKRASVDEIESVIALPGSSGGSPPPAQTVIDAGGGHTSALSFMLNGMLDFGDDDGFSGFVGGGAGRARIDFSRIRAFDDAPAYIDDGDSRFAWQIVAGVRRAISDNVDVTLRYRFFNVADITVPDYGGFDGKSGLRTHSLLAGLTFNFGATPPPP